MSEYLDRLKHLRDSKTPVGETAAVQTNVSFLRAIDYIEKMENQEAYLLARLKEADDTVIEKTIFINNQNIAINDLKNLLIDKGAQYFNHDNECYECVSELMEAE